MISVYFQSFIDIRDSQQLCPICDKKLVYYPSARVFMCHTKMDGKHFNRAASLNGEHYWNRYRFNLDDSFRLIQEVFYIGVDLYGETLTCFNTIDIRTPHYKIVNVKYDPLTQSAVQVAKDYYMM